tara:strand:- start:4822 stop:5175 length:354 start_codon:yes stop_codon:yes gene_type:complete
MKKKVHSHPSIFLKIVKKDDSVITVEYIDNEFDEFFKRKVKQRKITLPENFDNLYDDFNQIINKLNEQELIKTNNYLKTQNKILKYHKKNNNLDSIRVVEDSIKLMESFRLKLSNEF